MPPWSMSWSGPPCRIDLLLERPLPVLPAQGPALAVAGDRQLPAVQLALTAAGEAAAQSLGQVRSQSREGGVIREVLLLLGVGVEVVQLLGSSAARDVLPSGRADHAVVAVLVQHHDLRRRGLLRALVPGQQRRETAPGPQPVGGSGNPGQLEHGLEQAGRADQLVTGMTRGDTARAPGDEGDPDRGPPEVQGEGAGGLATVLKRTGPTRR